MRIPFDPAWRRFAGMWVFSGWILCFAGCGGAPQVEAEHRRLLLGLVTATSAKDQGLLDSVVAEIDAARRSGGISEPTDRSFGRIIQAARSGDWESARREAYRLRDAQEPTREDLDRLKRREMPSAKLPPTQIPARRSGS